MGLFLIVDTLKRPAYNKKSYAVESLGNSRFSFLAYNLAVASRVFRVKLGCLE